MPDPVRAENSVGARTGLGATRHGTEPGALKSVFRQPFWRRGPSAGAGVNTHMRNFWSDVAIRNRETDAMAQHLADRMHVFALVLTMIVLGMRLIAGRQDLTSGTIEGANTGVESATEVETPVLY